MIILAILPFSLGIFHCTYSLQNNDSSSAMDSANFDYYSMASSGEEMEANRQKYEWHQQAREPAWMHSGIKIVIKKQLISKL
jgi:hypothetical protein